MPSILDLDVGSRIQSPRPETPEPESRQGRRNAQPGAQLLDDDGGISNQVCRYIQSISKIT